MMGRSILLAQQRAMLVAECALQRSTLVAQIHSLSGVVSWIKSGHSLIDRLSHIPIWISTLVISFMVFMPGRPVALVKKGLALWQIWRSVTRRSADIK